MVPLHPKVVHIAIALAVLMPLISVGLLVAWWREWLPRRAWFIAVALQVVLVVGGFVAMNTGETDEERVEAVVPHAAIEAHEEAAEVFVWASVATLVLMAVAAGLPFHRPALIVALVASLATVGVFGLGYRVGEEGGKLVYEHHAAQVYQSTATPTSAPTAPNTGHGDHDD